MKTTLLTAVAAIALSLGAATASQAASPNANAAFDSVMLGQKPQIAKTGCFYRYFYVYNGYGYYYQYRYICY
jgi:hypothetical protein